MHDLTPATTTLAGLVAGVRDDQLRALTPCTDTTLGDLLDHVDGFSLAFTAAATKTSLPAANQRPVPDAARLGDDWRTRLPGRLRGLAEAWRDPSAWEGMTRAGGIDLPGEVAGLIALDEVVVHGWDIAVASGQPYTCDPQLLEPVYEWVRNAVSQSPNGTPGLFEAPVPVEEDAPLLSRLVGLTGRNPSWQPEGVDG